MQHIFPQHAHDVFHGVPLVYPREIDDACERIRDATDGLGVDEKVLVDELSALSASDRLLLIYRYKDLYREELKDTLSRDTIILGRTNEELSMLKSTYYYIFNKDLTWLMRSELSGDYREVILLALERLQVTYDPEIHTYARAKADAIKLYDAGEGRWGTDETTFIRILFSSPREHLVLVNDIYKKKYVSDLEEAVRAEFSGYATEALVFYVRLALEPHAAIADHFERMMKGLGTDEKGLSAAVIRYHWMQPRVEALYEKRHGRSLEERIRTDTDANYGDLLVTLLHIPTDGGGGSSEKSAPELAS